ncbi:MAG: sensor histidine kinase [Hamadaea sp.]|nr:sensor histidine kinase [Hamadaea sp.]
MRRQLTLVRQLLLFQLAIVLLVCGAVAAVSLAGADAAFRREQEDKLRSVAENLAATETVRQGMGDPIWSDSLAAAAETVRGVSGASFVLLTDAGGVLLTGADKGRRARLGGSDALSGRSWRGVVDPSDGGSKAYVAHAPVFAVDSGRFLGLAVVGQAYPSWPELLGAAIPDLLTYLLLGSALGVGGSLLLARRVKRQTLGLEPGEISGLVEHREAMLHGIKEGLLGLDATGRVTLANDEAIRLLGLPDDVAGASLRSLGLGAELTALLADDAAAPVQEGVVVHDSRILVLNRMPVVVRGRRVGSVTTLRDRTELASLERELDLSRHATDTLRAQAHEFTNRLHTISGLIQLGQYEDAVAFIVQAGGTHEALSRHVQASIADPALAALVIAKAAVASERHVDFDLDEDSDLPDAADEVLAADLVTVTGNLIDNAVDAAEAGGWVRLRVHGEGDEVVVRVRDSGDGVSPDLADKVFHSGFTTKADGHRGLGLALIGQVCAARGGRIEVEGSTFTVRLPRQRRRSAGTP